MNHYETESLIILAGVEPPYNQFYLQELTDKVLHELRLSYSDRDVVLKNYGNYLISKVINGANGYDSVLEKLRDLYYELDQDIYFQDFMLLYWAKDDLEYSEVQWYWEGADRGNIDKIIFDYFVNVALTG